MVDEKTCKANRTGQGTERDGGGGGPGEAEQIVAYALEHETTIGPSIRKGCGLYKRDEEVDAKKGRQTRVVRTGSRRQPSHWARARDGDDSIHRTRVDQSERDRDTTRICELGIRGRQLQLKR